VSDDESNPSAQIVDPALVEIWKAKRVQFAAELVEVQRKIGPLTAAIRQMDNLLKAVAPSFPGLEDWIKENISANPLIDDTNTTVEDVPLTNAIKRVLMGRREPPGRLTTRERIKVGLPSAGYPLDKINANPNYLYTALKRLVDRGEIIEAPGGNYRIK
jgi:hypothetical protein